MFTLRRISQTDGVQMNFALGDHYVLIDRERNYNAFCNTFEVYFKKPHVADLDEKSDDDTKRVYAFVCYCGFNQPLYKNQGNFIMMSNGKTFDNVSFR